MKTVQADERGRIALGAKLVSKFGKRFAVVSTQKDIVLVPIAKDPLAELKRIGKQAGIDKFTVAELKKLARESAMRESAST